MQSLAPLTYDYSALEPFIDEATMRVHHDKHHQTYVDNLNKIVAANFDLENAPLEQLIVDPRTKNMAGGVVNHNFFWEILSPPKTKDRLVNSDFSMNVVKKFGSFEKFVEEFSTKSATLFGSGWVWLTKELEIVSTPNQDVPDKKVILGLDVWEHAYYLKYQNRRKEYVEAWWNVVNWEKVEENFR